MLSFIKVLFFTQWCFSLIDADASISTCRGTCIDSESFCSRPLKTADCGIESICCLDFQVPTEQGFELESQNEEWFSTAENVESSDSDVSMFETHKISEGENPGFSTASDHSFYSTEIPIECPGACVPKLHSSSCEYIASSDNLCSIDQVCCMTTTDSSFQFQLEETNQETFVSECKGECIHNSLALHCDQILPGYCPADSKCCNKQTLDVKCPGKCLSPELTYLCQSPYDLIPETDCTKSTICCAIKFNSNFIVNRSLKKLDATENSQSAYNTAPEDLFSDENGELYEVYPDGQYKPLPKISRDDGLNPVYTHIGDVTIDNGKTSLFKDDLGMLYQLPIIQPFSSNSQSSFQMDSENEQADIHVKLEEEPETNFSAPDDSDDMEENMKDVILPDEGESVPENADISAAERTLIKPKCPGSCLSAFLRFSCTKDSIIYDSFSCPAKTVCCAKLDDVEEHEEYLKALSAFFEATPVDNEENAKKCLSNWINKTENEKQITDYCWQVALLNFENQYICGAVVIQDKWVLTAGHCVTGALKENKALYVRAGVADLTSTSDNAAGQTIRVASIFVHPKHNSMSLDNDLAILQLENFLQFNANVCIACLPSSNKMPQNDTDCMVSGYGFLNEAGSMSLKINDAALTVVDDIDCIANVTEAISTIFILPNSSLCAGGNGKEDNCQGDAGAPLMCYNGDHFELTGLTSWSLGCGRNDVPSIYVKISNFISWINQIITASPFLESEL